MRVVTIIYGKHNSIAIFLIFDGFSIFRTKQNNVTTTGTIGYHKDKRNCPAPCNVDKKKLTEKYYGIAIPKMPKKKIILK